jgi:glycosyltransferase involved in cell wall biosynthesis
MTLKLLFSAINCTLDTSNGAAISIKTFMRFLSQYGVECRTFSANVYDRPGPGDALANLTSTGALPVQEPGLPQTLWLSVDGDVQHYIEFTEHMTQRDFSLEDEQTIYNRMLRMLDTYQPDVLLLYGSRRYERSLLRKARERGIATVFYLVHPGYKKLEAFTHVDHIFTDTEATRQLFAERFGFDCQVIGKFIEKPVAPSNAQSPQYVTFINPSSEKGVTLFLRIVELAAQTLPEAKFLVVESRSSLSTAERRTGIDLSRYPNLTRVGLQKDMGAVFAATKVLLALSLWHDSGPRVSVEALSMGIPAVVTNRGGLPELVGNAGIVIDPPAPLVQDHWLVPPLTDAIPWVEVLRGLLTDREVYRQYQQASFERWREHDPALRLPGIVARLETLVNEVKARAAAQA